MSGTIQQLIAQPQPLDYLSPLQKMATIGQTNAASGLLGQQAAGAALENQLKALQVGRTSFVYDLAGIPHPAVGGGAPGAAPSAGGAPAAAGGSAGGSGTSFPGELGMSMLGQPMPKLLAAQVLTAPDVAAALKTANETRRQVIFSTVSGAGPQGYQGAMQQLYSTGYLTPQMLADAMQHPEGRGRILAATQTPDSYASMLTAAHGQGLQPNPNTQEVEPSVPAITAAGLRSGAEEGGRQGASFPYVLPRAAAAAAGGGAYTTTEVKEPDPDRPGSYRTVAVQTSALPDYLKGRPGATAVTAGDMSDPTVTLGPGGFVGRVGSFENGGGAANASNPRSSALGNGQFLDQTWLDVVHATKPPWAAGMNDAQILAQRTSREHSNEMTYAYAQQNAPKLQAGGQPVNSLSLGLAHQFGPDGAIAVMKAAPGTPMRSLVSPAVMAANPQLANMTAAQAQAAAFTHYGVNAVDLNQPYSAAGGPTAGKAAVPGPPALTPQQTAALDVTKGMVEKDSTTVDANLGIAKGAQSAQTQLTQIRDLIPQINAGSFAGAAQSVQNYLATYAPEFAQRFATAVSAGRIDPTKANATQEFVKLTLTQAGQAEQQVLGKNSGYGALQLYREAFPNIEMQPTAIRDMTNLLLIAHQRDIDFAQQSAGYFNRNREGFLGGGQYNSLQKFEAQFQQSNGPQVYVGAAAALNQKPFAEWAHALTPQQQRIALDTVFAADPTAHVFGPGGKVYAKPGAR